MIRKSFIAKNPPKENIEQSSDAVTEEPVDEAPQIHEHHASEVNSDHQDKEASVISESEETPAPSSDVDKTAASNDQNLEAQVANEIEPGSVQLPGSQHLEMTPDAQPETEEVDEEVFISKELLQHVFRSEDGEPIPLLDERLACLHEAGKVVHEVCLVFATKRIGFTD